MTLRHHRAHDHANMCASAKFWMSVLTDLKNRGIRDVFFVVCDGLKGLPDVVASVWPQAIVQTCIVHYPDTAVMPICGRLPLAAGVAGLAVSA